MAKTLLMIHGVGCGGEVWDRMRGPIEAAGWTCEAPTLFPNERTVGEPPEALKDLRLSDYIDAMATKAAEIEARDGEKPAVIGHSMGGLIAQHLAVQGAVKAGIFLTPAQPEGCTVTDLRVLRTFWNILKVGRKNVPGGAFKVGPIGFSYGVLNAVPKARHAEIYAGALYDSGRVYEDLSEPAPIDEGKLGVPTLTIGAKKDRATVVKAVRKVGAKYAKALVAGDYAEYPKNAHWIVDEPGTELVTADIIAWLEANAV